MKIKNISSFEILDSRGMPTVKTIVTLGNGPIGWSAVPSGASTGSHEAVELRDNDSTRFFGKGVLKAANNVNSVIAKEIIGMNAEDQKRIDKKMIELDGTENKSKLGANAILSVSLAVARAQADAEKKSLYQYLSRFNPNHTKTYFMPIPMMNIMNGGKHANWSTDIQEYMILPIKASSIREAVRMCAEIYHALKSVLKSKGYSILVGDEGGFAPSFISNREPFEFMAQAVKEAGYKIGTDVVFGIDAAASEFFKNGVYVLKKENKSFSRKELENYYLSLKQQYPITSFEDVFSEDDWDGFKSFYNATQGKVQLVGDDLYVTNIKRLKKGIKEKATNSILIKLNQIGTLSETVDAIILARKNGMTAIVSHRSGETEDPFIADFVVAMGTGQIKTGAPCRSERTIKYNRLMEIEQELGASASYTKYPFYNKLKKAILQKKAEARQRSVTEITHQRIVKNPLEKVFQDPHRSTQRTEE
jgi:enolase